MIGVKSSSTCWWLGKKLDAFALPHRILDALTLSSQREGEGRLRTSG